MKVNWIVRIKNKLFWVAIIPMLLLLIRQICLLFGFELEVSALSDRLVEIVYTVFSILALLGIVNDPTTASLSDSKKALTYTKPKEE